MEMCVNACEKHTTNNENAAKMIKGWLISNGILSSVRSSTQSNRVQVECRRPTRWPAERVKKELQG